MAGKGDMPMKRNKSEEAPEEQEEEVVDYSTSGPDIKFHKKVSNTLFCAALLGILGLLAVMVFMDLRKKLASGKHGTQLGTTKGL